MNRSTANSDAVDPTCLFDELEFAVVRRIWREEIGESLDRERARQYGPKLLALVLAVARARQLGLLP